MGRNGPTGWTLRQAWARAHGADHCRPWLDMRLRICVCVCFCFCFCVVPLSCSLSFLARLSSSRTTWTTSATSHVTYPSGDPRSRVIAGPKLGGGPERASPKRKGWLFQGVPEVRRECQRFFRDSPTTTSSSSLTPSRSFVVCLLVFFCSFD